VANTYRFRGHSMSDPLKYRSKEEAEKARLRDPTLIYERRLVEKGLIDDGQLEAMQTEVQDEVDQATQQAEADPYPPLEDRFNDVLAESYPLQK
jgi:pyruvate dehydrogenase E1 component alpha subunit